MITFCADARMIHNSGIGVYIRQYLTYILKYTPYQIILLGRRTELNECFGQFINWTFIEADFPIYSLQEQIRLPYLIPICDVFWSPHYNVPLIPIRARKRLVTVPDVFHLAHLEVLTPIQKIYAQIVTRAAVYLADRITTISKFSAEEIVRLTGTSTKKMIVIPLGLDKGLFRRIVNESTYEQVRIKYNLPHNYVLFVGNVKPNKNLRRLVEAFALLLVDFPDYYLLIAGKRDGFIIGDSSLADYINADTQLVRRVCFSGYVDLMDLPIIYNMAAIFCFPSLYEGFGFPPLEAMACGCPIVASNWGSIPEVCGTAAHYINPADVKDIARGLRDVLTDTSLRVQLIKDGLAHIQQFDWTESQQQFVQEVENLIC